MGCQVFKDTILKSKQWFAQKGTVFSKQKRETLTTNSVKQKIKEVTGMD